jgi:uncharacterized protein
MKVEHDAEAHRFQVRLSTGTAVLAYTPSGDKRLDMYSTYVPTAARGQGVAAALVEAALAYAREGGFLVIPSCWYVALWIRRHPEYADLLAA